MSSHNWKSLQRWTLCQTKRLKNDKDESLVEVLLSRSMAQTICWPRYESYTWRMRSYSFMRLSDSAICLKLRRQSRSRRLASMKCSGKLRSSKSGQKRMNKSDSFYTKVWVKLNWDSTSLIDTVRTLNERSRASSSSILSRTVCMSSIKSQVIVRTVNLMRPRRSHWSRHSSQNHSSASIRKHWSLSSSENYRLKAFKVRTRLKEKLPRKKHGRLTLNSSSKRS